MQEARLDIQVSRNSDNDGLVQENGQAFKTTKTGIDEIEFFLAANPGAPPRPLVKVASGGEISRVMLALKLAQADADRLPVMIFDEIDSGVSGRMAQAVGRNLKRLSRAHQIICITHLPQIASVGDYHFFVEKISDGKQTRTIIRQLSNEERTLAVARLLGGEKISETHLESARQLIDEGQSFN
jgi:DNA repair protein RecN (Recombination protein N)